MTRSRLQFVGSLFLALSLFFSVESHAATVTFQGKTLDVSYIPLPANMPSSNGCDLIFVYFPSNGQKLLVIPTDPNARASYDPDAQRFYRVDRTAGFINGFTTLDSTFVNLDGTFNATKTEAPQLVNGQSTLDSFQIPLEINTTFPADIALVDGENLVYRTSETKIYDINHSGNSIVQLTHTIPMSTTSNVSMDHDGINDTLLMVQTKATDTATKLALTDRLRSYTRVGELFDEILFVGNPNITGYKGNASGVAVDPLNGDIYVLDVNQLIAFRAVVPKSPTVTGLSPKSGSYKGGTTVQITGNLFPSDTTVYFDGIPSASVTVNTAATLVTCVTPAHTIGAVDVTLKGTGIPVGTPLTLSSGFSYVNAIPNAVLSASPNTGTAPLTVMFDISASNDPDGKLVKRVMDFGDGCVPYTFPADLTNVSVSHTFASNGTYKAFLVVTDDLGATATSSQIIVVGTGGNDVTLNLVLSKLSLKVAVTPAPANKGSDKLQLAGEIILPDNVTLADLANGTYTISMVGPASADGYLSDPAITLDGKAQYNQQTEKFLLKANKSRSALPNSYVLTYMKSYSSFPNILDAAHSGRQALYIAIEVTTPLGRKFTFAKTSGESNFIVDVKSARSSSTLKLLRK